MSGPHKATGGVAQNRTNLLRQGSRDGGEVWDGGDDAVRSKPNDGGGKGQARWPEQDCCRSGSVSAEKENAGKLLRSTIRPRSAGSCVLVRCS
eukprot:2223230-Rhodomonas_salina.2